MIPTASGPSPHGPVAVVMAGARGAGLHELTDREAPAALFMAGRRRLVDYALQEVARAGLGRALALTGWRPDTLRGHLAGAAAGGAPLEVVEGAEGGADAALARAAAWIDGAAGGPSPPREVVVLSGCRAGAFDLAALIAAHRAGGGAVTLLAEAGPGGAASDPDARGLAPAGALVLDWPWARDRLVQGCPGSPQAGIDLPAALLARAADEGGLRAVSQPAATWRAAATPDAFRRAWLELLAGVPFPLPPEHGPSEEPSGAATDLVVEAGGLTLTVPRFGARRGGRWTLLEDSVVMPGARVAPGARLARALVAPGAIVPAGLVVGEDAGEDARWFRLAPPEGPAAADAPATVLVTPAMLARRAAERMRLHAAAPVTVSALAPIPNPVPSPTRPGPGESSHLTPPGLTPLESP